MSICFGKSLFWRLTGCVSQGFCVSSSSVFRIPSSWPWQSSRVRFSTRSSVIFWIDDKKAHWSLWAWSLSLINSLLWFFLADFWNGRAIRLPKPPLGIVSWLGNNLSYDLKCISCLLFMEKVKMAVPNFLANAAGIGFSKKNHRCAPLPDCDRSTATGISNSVQTSRTVVTSFCQRASSKSIAKKWQVSSGSIG